MKTAKFTKRFSFRFTLIYMSIFAASIVLIGFLIYLSFEQKYYAELKRSIQSEINQFEARYKKSGLLGVTNYLKLKTNGPNAKNDFVFQIQNRKSEVLSKSSDLFSPTIQKNTTFGWTLFEDEQKIDESHELDISIFGRFTHLDKDTILFVGINLQDRPEDFEFIYDAIYLILGVTLLLGAAIGILMSYVINRKISRINNACASILSGNLSQRIPLDGSGDEFDFLINNLNNMLSSQEILIDGIKHVTDNVAHDLRTPLTRLYSSLEYLKRQAGNKSIVEDIDLARADARHLLTVFQSILRISELENGTYDPKFDALDLSHIISDVIEYYEPLAQEKNINIHFEHQSQNIVHVQGDRDLLFQAFSNILDNSIKFAPSESQIIVEINEQSKTYQIAFTDEGPGVPIEYKDKIFERFFRVEGSRNQPGYGLGLSLVRSVATIHHGFASVSCAPSKGLIVCLSIPKLQL